MPAVIASFRCLALAIRSAVRYAGRNGCEITTSASGSSRSNTDPGPSLSEATTKVWPLDSRYFSTLLAEFIGHGPSSGRFPLSARPSQLINVGPAQGLDRKQIAPAFSAWTRLLSSGKAVTKINGTP